LSVNVGTGGLVLPLSGTSFLQAVKKTREKTEKAGDFSAF
jgi:hypothetical protein